MRRFSRTVMNTGFAKLRKKKLFHEKKPNRRKQRESAIRRKRNKEQREYEIKIGKVKENVRYGRGRRSK